MSEDISLITQNRINNLEETFSNIDTNIGTLNTNVSNVNENLNNQVTIINNSLTDINTTITNNQNDLITIINDLKSRIQTLESRIYITENWKSGNNWCRVYSDGWCEQGGSATNTGGTITLHRTMSNTNYTCVVVHNGASAKGEGFVHAYNKQVSQFSYGLSYSTSGMSGMSWFVCGY